ncbi:hypothetical protein [Labilithrix luteola]|nr:hypothetical protein [Labilithrix luteola]
MNKHAVWVVPGILTMTTLLWAPACSSSDDTGSSDIPDSGNTNAETGTKPGNEVDSSAPTDSSVPDVKNDVSDPDANGDSGSVDPYVAACARIDACATATSPLIGMNGCYSLITAKPFASSLFGLELAQLENLRCKLAATTCTAVRACDKPTTDYTTFCQTAEGGNHCDGNVHVLCDANTFAPIMATDCAATGEICGEANFQAGCGKTACEPYNTTINSCAGNVLTSCAAYGVTREIDCAANNDVIYVKPAGKKTLATTVCGAGTDGNKACLADGADCTGLTQRCDGTVLETCTMGKLARRDCAAQSPSGQGCVTALTDGPDRIQGSLACGAVNPPCHETDNETCDVATGTIGFCALTEAKTLDCKSLGYTGCKTTTVNGRVTAACFQ